MDWRIPKSLTQNQSWNTSPMETLQGDFTGTQCPWGGWVPSTLNPANCLLQRGSGIFENTMPASPWWARCFQAQDGNLPTHKALGQGARQENICSSSLWERNPPLTPFPEAGGRTRGAAGEPGGGRPRPGGLAREGVLSEGVRKL